jgi:putative pyruvate formate lyase activating enzyme
MKPHAHAQLIDRAELVLRRLESCDLCPRRCGVNRRAGQLGFCGLGDSPICFREMLHNHEESQLNPSHQVYFAGCNLRCGFCTVAEYNEQIAAIRPIPLDRLAARIQSRKREGAATLNLLGGEPAVNLVGILSLLSQIDPATVVVWNSNMYYNACVDCCIEGVADIVLADFKCGNAVCSRDLLDAEDYVSVVRDNLCRAARHADLIVRHLVVPGHRACCTVPVLQWLATHLPQVKVSLRFDYIPPVNSRTAPKTYGNRRDQMEVLECARNLRLNLIQ